MKHSEACDLPANTPTDENHGDRAPGVPDFLFKSILDIFSLGLMSGVYIVDNAGQLSCAQNRGPKPLGPTCKGIRPTEPNYQVSCRTSPI